MIAWGVDETEQFKRQSRLFARVLDAAGPTPTLVEAVGRNHFDIIGDLARETTDWVGPSVDSSTRRRETVPDLLARRGLSIDAAALDRDWSVEYSPNASVESAWRQVYREAGADDELRRLGEALISLDQQFSLYRWRHFSSVERIIGYKPGTRWFGRHRMAGARHQTPFLPRDLGHQQLSVERDGHARIYGTSAT